MARWVSETRPAHDRRLRRPRHGRQGRIDRHVRARSSIRASAASSRSRARTSANAPNGISSAMSNIFPAEGEIMLFDRSWYNRAGVEKVMGFCTPEQTQEFLNAVAGVRAASGRRRHPAVQILAVLRPGRAGGKVRKPARQPDETVEAVADRYQGARALRRLYRSARDDAVGDPHRLCAVDAGRFQRPGAGPADVASRPARPGAGHRAAAGRDSVAAARS